MVPANVPLAVFSLVSGMVDGLVTTREQHFLRKHGQAPFYLRQLCFPPRQADDRGAEELDVVADDRLHASNSCLAETSERGLSPFRIACNSELPSSSFVTCVCAGATVGTIDVINKTTPTASRVRQCPVRLHVIAEHRRVLAQLGLGRRVEVAVAGELA